MCRMCDGATREEMRADLRRKIDTNGWAAQAVEPGNGFPGWVYTIGLMERFGHPEFVVVACDAVAAYAILTDLVLRVEAGGWLADLDEVRLHDGTRSLGWAHAAQLRAGLLSSWTDLYGTEGRTDLPLGALVIEAPDLVCPACRAVDLRQASPLLSGQSRNRDERRAAARSARANPNRQARQRRRRRR